MRNSKQEVVHILSKAGIAVNGTAEHDIQVYNPSFYSRVLGGGSLALGETYMEKWWDAKRVDLFIEKLLRAKIKNSMSVHSLMLAMKSRIFNMQSFSNAKKVIHEHYDKDNDLYMSFLDPYNQYTCGYFKNTNNLNTAQEQKLDLICRKLELSEKDNVLDIGCGWGGFAKYAATKYGCTVTGVTLSKEQLAYAKEFTKGLPVTLKLSDYRNLKDKYDKIVVVGMIEHVGYKNYRLFMKKVHSVLKKDGLFLLHTIGGDITRTHPGDPWINKYIFPNGMLPSFEQLGKATNGLFLIEDCHNFGVYYHKTLLAWDENFRKNWPSIKGKYSETFYRMFRYYFLACAGAFKSRTNQLWQIVFSKGSRDTVYQSVR